MCGLCGIITRTPRIFDFSTLTTLGVVNDERGGDSCGVFIDGKYEYGVGATRLFSSYFLESELLYNTKLSKIALVHCRKASIGAITEKQAQPVIITNNSGRVDFVLMHNGTIHNYKELAKKYIPDIDITGFTDSQVMAHIFYNCGYDVLDEYNGGAVFVIVDYRNNGPHTFLFKGASKQYTYSKDKEEERPLYYTINPIQRELVFSSIGIYLCTLRKDYNAYSLTPNVLWKFVGNGLVKIKAYTREKCTQRKVVATYNTNYGVGYNTNYGVGGAGFSDYICVNTFNNIYTHNGTRVNGKVAVTKWGMIYSNKTSVFNHDAFFFDGVLLQSKSCMRFLEHIKKRSGLKIEDFREKYQNLIRYLSVDGIYRGKDGIIYQALSPNKAIPFTGTYHPFTTTTKDEYKSGKLVQSVYGQGVKELDDYIPRKAEFNFKAIKKECK